MFVRVCDVSRQHTLHKDTHALVGLQHSNEWCANSAAHSLFIHAETLDADSCRLRERRAGHAADIGAPAVETRQYSMPCHSMLVDLSSSYLLIDTSY